MKSLFEQIDALEPIIPQEEMNATNYIRWRLWCEENPEQYRAIVKRSNDKRNSKTKEGEQ